MVRTYTEGFRRAMVRRLTGPKARTASALGEEVGVCHQTLSRWLREAGEGAEMKDGASAESARGSRGKSWPPAERLRVLGEAQGLEEGLLGAYLRREGLHQQTLDQWREQALTGLGDDVSRARATKVDRLRIAELERELLRKDKALAETAALLVLRKKVEALHLFEDDALTVPLASRSSQRSPRRSPAGRR